MVILGGADLLWNVEQEAQGFLRVGLAVLRVEIALNYCNVCRAIEVVEEREWNCGELRNLQGFARNSVLILPRIEI
jgi:hypothetical protein